jgi:hypothetical protein
MELLGLLRCHEEQLFVGQIPHTHKDVWIPIFKTTWQIEGESSGMEFFTQSFDVTSKYMSVKTYILIRRRVWPKVWFLGENISPPNTLRRRRVKETSPGRLSI